MATTINASTSSGIVATADGSGILKVQSNGVTTNALAWVNFSGATSPGTIRSAYNVSSVTRNATGCYTLTFTNTLTDANYALAGMGGNNTTSLACVVQPYNLSAPTTSSVRVQSVRADGTMDVNPPTVSVVIFGN